jgi:phosphinothricin acetyltransferase
MKDLVIRLAILKDLDAITEIYNEAILKTVASFDTEPKSLEEQKIWFESHDSKYSIIVGELGKKIIGWASLSEYSARCAYSDTAEVSVYVLENYQGKGFGRKILEEIISRAEKHGFHVVIARIAEGNKISIHLFESMGFFHVGVMKEVGRKFGKLLDVYIMQKIFKK